MTGLLLQMGATKLAVSVVLGGAVWILHRRVGRPAVSHPLWLLVLMTLLVPAVVSLPVLPPDPVLQVTTPVAPAVGAPGAEFAEVAADPGTPPPFGALLQPGLAALWLLGTAGLVGWTTARTIRFRRTLWRALRPAPVRLRRQATEIGRDLGLSRIPELYIADARVTPLVWWTGGKVRVLIPAFLLTDLSTEELRAVLAHELAHVRRRDHLVRWLEWLACSVFWWNPVAWLARHQLQIAEESCCDQLAVAAARSCPKTYAKALLRVVANAADPPGFRPPLSASAVDGAGRAKALERRIRTIVSTDASAAAPRWLRTTSRVTLLCALPLGIIYCDRRVPTAGETAMGLAEVPALDGMDQLRAAPLEATGAPLSRRVAELQKLIHYQEILWKAAKPGNANESVLREASGYLTNGMEREITELFLARSAEHNRGRRSDESSPHTSTGYHQNPELSGALAAMRELVEEIRQAPDSNARSEEQNRRIRELNARIHAAIGLGFESEL